MNKKYNFNFLVSIFLLLIICGCTEVNTDPPPADVEAIFERPVEEIPFEDLLELVQKTTFKYFWDFAEPNSGLARESSLDDLTVTIGGSGFGISAFPIAVERGWITRGAAIERMDKILTFLEGAEKYHGAFSHWYYGDTGITREFSSLDNGGDLVETAFLVQGLFIVQQYFSGTTAEESAIRNRIDAIWKNIEWNWYVQPGENVITWHWSRNFGFDLNLKIEGWNESLLVYVLAAASPTFPISRDIYIDGWARSGNQINGNTYFGVELPLGVVKGGPLFYAHYSFIGLDPRNLTDQYANYFEQNRAHTLVNYNHCVENPFGYKGYGENSWGLTASNDFNGYAVHEPENDIGVITPTAALSSFPYTPVESQRALEYFYYDLNADLWGEYGFYDAFSESQDWYDDGYLAIDQGPIICMIENYRTGLLWDLFMQNQEVLDGLTKLGFTY
tara:strand:+ start:9398 stop:10735 length:1338 start_codon:yes stop_codon:yes gene_type:complete